MQVNNQTKAEPILFLKQSYQAGVPQFLDNKELEDNFEVVMPNPALLYQLKFTATPRMNVPIRVQKNEVFPGLLAQRQAIVNASGRQSTVHSNTNPRKVTTEKFNEIPSKLKDYTKIERIVKELNITILDLKNSLSSKEQLAWCDQAEVLIEKLVQEVKDKNKFLIQWANTHTPVNISSISEKTFSDSGEDIKFPDAHLNNKGNIEPKDLDLNRYKAQVDKMKEMLKENHKQDNKQLENNADSISNHIKTQDIVKDLLNEFSSKFTKELYRLIENYEERITLMDNKVRNVMKKLSEVKVNSNIVQVKDDSMITELIKSNETQEQNIFSLIKCLQEKENSMKVLLNCLHEKELFIQDIVKQLKTKDSSYNIQSNNELSKISTGNNLLVEMKKELLEVDKDMSEIIRKVQEKEKEMKELTLDLEKKKKVANALHEKDKEIKDLIEQFSNNTQVKKGELEKLETTLHEQDNKMKHINEVTQSQELIIRKLTTHIQEQDANIKDLNERWEKNEEVIKELKEKNKSIDELLNDLLDNLQVKDSTLAELQDELQNTEARIQELTLDLEEKKRKLQELSTHSQANTDQSLNNLKDNPLNDSTEINHIKQLLVDPIPHNTETKEELMLNFKEVIDEILEVEKSEELINKLKVLFDRLKNFI